MTGAVLIGNSLGGPAAIEAALLAGTRVLAIVGVDTFQDLSRTVDANRMNEVEDAWRRDFQGSMDQSLRMLLHPDTEPGVYEDIRRRMPRTPLETICGMFWGFAGYDAGASARIESIRRVLPDFEAVVLEEFNRRLAEILQGLAIS